KYRDKLQLNQFLVTLRDDFEPTHASLLNRQPLPSLDTAISELISEETKCLTTISQRSSFVIVATSFAPKKPDNSKRPCCIHCYRIIQTVKTCMDIVRKPPSHKNAAATTTTPSGTKSSP
ncbi:hypothetical protein CFOL_v3_06163, partial [Cephalotus follicularis]